ncbi:hypothetical protein [Nocardia thraciensis]
MPGHPLTANATVICSHGGAVHPIPSRSLCTAGGSAVLVLPDLIGAPITGCGQPPPAVPCTLTVSVVRGASPLTAIGGVPVLLDTAVGVTNGVPPGTFSVVAAGQTVVVES